MTTSEKTRIPNRLAALDRLEPLSPSATLFP